MYFRRVVIMKGAFNLILSPLSRPAPEAREGGVQRVAFAVPEGQCHNEENGQRANVGTKELASTRKLYTVT